MKITHIHAAKNYHILLHVIKDSIMVLRQMLAAWLYVIKAGYGTPYYVVLILVEVRHQDKLVPDFHAAQYVLVRSTDVA